MSSLSKHVVFNLRSFFSVALRAVFFSRRILKCVSNGFHWAKTVNKSICQLLNWKIALYTIEFAAISDVIKIKSTASYRTDNRLCQFGQIVATGVSTLWRKKQLKISDENVVTIERNSYRLKENTAWKSPGAMKKHINVTRLNYLLKFQQKHLHILTYENKRQTIRLSRRNLCDLKNRLCKWNPVTKWLLFTE